MLVKRERMKGVIRMEQLSMRQILGVKDLIEDTIEATVIAIATPVHRGRRTQVWQTRLQTEEGKLVAIVTQTQMVL